MRDFLKKLIKNPFVVNLLLMFVAFVLVICGTLKWLEGYTHHGQVVLVPDVKGLVVDAAVSFFENNELRYDVIDSVYSDNVAPGAIVEMTPQAGSKVKRGRTVFLTVNSQTVRSAAIPGVRDLSFRQAYALLRAQGFETVEVEYVPGEYKDLVVGVEWHGRELDAGEMVALSAVLLLKVSNGEGDAFVLPSDSLNLEMTPVRPLDSEDERWF